MRTDADRIGELGEPVRCLICDEGLERFKRVHPCLRFGQLGLAQLCHQLQQPGGTIRAFEARAVWALEISQFALDVLRRKALAERRNDGILVGRRRIRIQDAHEQPVTMHR